MMSYNSPRQSSHVSWPPIVLFLSVFIYNLDQSMLFCLVFMASFNCWNRGNSKAVMLAHHWCPQTTKVLKNTWAEYCEYHSVDWSYIFVVQFSFSFVTLERLLWESTSSAARLTRVKSPCWYWGGMMLLFYNRSNSRHHQTSHTHSKKTH